MRVADGRGKTQDLSCSVEVTRNEDSPYFISDPYTARLDIDNTLGRDFYTVSANDDDKSVSIFVSSTSQK